MLSAVACLFSVLGAKELSRFFEPLDRAAREHAAMRRLFEATPTAGAPQSVTIVRSVGVDGVTTATIPNRPIVSPQPLAPCGAALR